MALSDEHKEALAAYYKNQDLYDPSKASEQEVSTFTPKAMCGGGEMGMAQGGSVPGIELGEPLPFGASDFAGPSLSGDTATARGLNGDSLIPEPEKMALPQPPGLSGPAPRGARAPLPPPVISPAPSSSPVASPDAGKLSSAQFDELIKGLQPSFGNRLAQGITSGAAGFADAIESGVARAGSPGFMKNIEESRQNERETLTNALKAKYESGYKGRELNEAQKRLEEETRHNRAMELEAAGRVGAENKGRELEAKKLTKEEAEKQREFDLKTVQEYGLFKTGGPSREAYNQAKTRLESQGGAGGAAEVLRTVNGKPAVFDANTKKFIRWQE